MSTTFSFTPEEIAEAGKLSLLTLDETLEALNSKDFYKTAVETLTEKLWEANSKFHEAQDILLAILYFKQQAEEEITEEEEKSLLSAIKPSLLMYLDYTIDTDLVHLPNEDEDDLPAALRMCAEVIGLMAKFKVEKDELSNYATFQREFNKWDKRAESDNGDS